MSYRLTAERIGDTVLVQIDAGDRQVVLDMGADQAVQFGWDLLALGAADAPALTPQLVLTGRRL